MENFLKLIFLRDPFVMVTTKCNLAYSESDHLLYWSI